MTQLVPTVSRPVHTSLSWLQINGGSVKSSLKLGYELGHEQLHPTVLPQMPPYGKSCLCHDSKVVFPCAKFNLNPITIIWVILLRFRNASNATTAVQTSKVLNFLANQSLKFGYSWLTSKYSRPIFAVIDGTISGHLFMFQAYDDNNRVVVLSNRQGDSVNE